MKQPRSTAVPELTRVDDVEKITEIVELLKSDDWNLALRAGEALCAPHLLPSLNPARNMLVATLAAAIEDPQFSARWIAVHALERLIGVGSRLPDVAQHFVDRVTHWQPGTRWMAIKALGIFAPRGDVAFLEPLVATICLRGIGNGDDPALVGFPGNGFAALESITRLFHSTDARGKAIANLSACAAHLDTSRLDHQNARRFVLEAARSLGPVPETPSVSRRVHLIDWTKANADFSHPVDASAIDKEAYVERQMRELDAMKEQGGGVQAAQLCMRVIERSPPKGGSPQSDMWWEGKHLHRLHQGRGRMRFHHVRCGKWSYSCAFCTLPHPSTSTTPPPTAGISRVHTYLSACFAPARTASFHHLHSFTISRMLTLCWG